MRSLATEEAIVASSSPAPPLRGLGAHRDRCVAIFHGMSDDACKGAPAPARHMCASRLVEPSARTRMLIPVCARDSQP